jgi:hypothetical protein
VEETLEVFIGGLIPQLPLHRGCIGIGGFLLAGPLRRGGAFPRGLVAPLAKALRELLDLAALDGTVASPRMDRVRPGVGALLTWALASGVLAPVVAAATAGPPTRGLSKPRFFLLFFLPLPRAATLGPLI